ncbi:MAG TPA: hypothetical protein VLJ68_00770, partial [Chitinophagaceae bacterium]|nr:hypothetical protein [Chitinophagaceae bacterium]
MKKQMKSLKWCLPFLILLTAFSGITQGSITHTANKDNRSGNGDCSQLDIPQILGNPAALLFISQKEQGSNQHPISAFYFKTRWNVMNLDQAGISDGSRFEVEYFITPDNDHFQYVIKREDIRKDGSAILNHPALNDHPDSKFEIFHTWVPESKEYANREETTIEYYPSLNRWILSNVNKKILIANVAYNIAVSFHGKAVSNPVTTNPVTNPINTNPVNTNPVYTTPVTTNPTTPSTNNSGTVRVSAVYMSIWSAGIKLPGENLISAHMDQTQLLGFNMGVVSPRDLATGQGTGKRQYEAVTIQCELGFPAAILIFDAFLKGKSITLNFDFIGP